RTCVAGIELLASGVNSYFRRYSGGRTDCAAIAWRASRRKSGRCAAMQKTGRALTDRAAQSIIIFNNDTSAEQGTTMPSPRADLITHPIRARILGALMGRQLTIGQIALILPDVPVPSLYRHVRTLTEGGVLEAVSQQRVNGALTRVYATRKEQTIIG